jgi:hypothetical protein
MQRMHAALLAIDPDTTCCELCTRERIGRVDHPLATVVMTTHNRRKQTLFALDSIVRPNLATPMQIVLVDDSDSELILRVDLARVVANSCTAVDWVRIRPEARTTWVNPCINYNVGFRFIGAPLVVIQNGEVCHDANNLVLPWVLNRLVDNEYAVFDVRASPSFDANERLYAGHAAPLDAPWCHHHTERPTFFHFLVALTAPTLSRIGRFNIEYMLDANYDDNAWLLAVAATIPRIRIAPQPFGGTHLFHAPHVGFTSHLNMRHFFYSLAVYNATGHKALTWAELTHFSQQLRRVPWENEGFQAEQLALFHASLAQKKENSP